MNGQKLPAVSLIQFKGYFLMTWLNFLEDKIHTSESTAVITKPKEMPWKAQLKFQHCFNST